MVIIIRCIFSNNAMHIFPLCNCLLPLSLSRLLPNLAKCEARRVPYMKQELTYLHSPPIFNGTCGSALYLFYSGSSLTIIIIHEPENVELLLVHFIHCYQCNWQTTFLVSLLEFWSSDTRWHICTNWGGPGVKTNMPIKSTSFSFHLFVYVCS